MSYSLRENEMGFNESFSSEKTEEELVQDLKNKGLAVYQDTIRYYPIKNDKNLYYRLSRPNDTAVQWTPVPHAKDSALYLQRVSTPFYVIPFYVIDSDTLKNIEFTISPTNKKKKRSSIVIESFQATTYQGYYSEQRKRFVKQFKQLFSGL